MHPFYCFTCLTKKLEKLNEVCRFIVFFFFTMVISAQALNTEVDLLQEGKRSLENGQYQKAVSCIGELLTKSGNESQDPKVLALHLASQAYGMMSQFKDPAYNKTIENNLLRAIDLDPEWQYPKRLLEQFRGQKKPSYFR